MTSTVKSTAHVSDNPVSNAVTVPQDAKFKEADVDRKMRFYGVIQAFRQGRMPDNEQIFNALAYAEKNSPVDTSKLSAEGKKLIQDVRDIIASLRTIVQTKNTNEEIQNFVHAAAHADYQGSTGFKSPTTKDEAKKDAETAGEACQTLIKLFLRNGEVRKLVSDMGLVGRDMFADGAQFMAGKARPDQEQLAGVDQPAPDNHFHDDIPDSLKTKSAEQKQAEQAELQQKDAQREAEIEQAIARGEDPQAARAKANANKVADRIPEKHKEIAKEHKDKTVAYLKENFPEERRDQFIYRLKKVLVECQRHKDYQDAMEFFISAFENYKGVANDAHTQIEQNAKSVGTEGNVQSAQQQFRRVLERFANGRPSQPMFDALDVIYNDCAKDPELKSYFQQLDKYVRRCLVEPGFVMRDEANTQARQLRQQGKKYFTGETKDSKGKYQPHFENLFNEVNVFFTAMGDDPINKEFGEKWHKLGRDIFFNNDGKLTYKPHLWDDIRDPILPQLLKHVGYIPIARMEYSDPMIDLVIENMQLDPANLMPNLIEIEGYHFHRMSAFKNIRDNHKGSIKLLLSQIQTDIRDVAWSINKKQGFPSLKDSGLADVFLGGKGLTIAVALETRSNSRDVFTVKEVTAKLDKLDFAVRKSHHDTLIKILRPLARSVIKKAVTGLAEGAIRDALEKVNKNLVAARDAEQGRRGEVLKERFSSDKSKSSQPKGQFKIPTSKQDSILPTMGAKDGWVNKIDAAAKKAESTGPQHKPDWYSPAFSIVPQQAGAKPKVAATATHGSTTGSSASRTAGAGGLAGATAATAAVPAGASAQAPAPYAQAAPVSQQTATQAPQIPAGVTSSAAPTIQAPSTGGPAFAGAPSTVTGAPATTGI